MNKNLHLPALLTVGLLAVGCEKKSVEVAMPSPTPIILDVAPQTGTNTVETSRLGRSIDQFVATPSAANSADVKKAFAELDGEIAELEARVAQTTGQDRSEAQAKLTNLQTYRAKETARFAAASATTPFADTAPIDVRSGAEKVEDSLEKAGDNIKDTAENVGNAIKDGAEKAGEKIQDATGN